MKHDQPVTWSEIKNVWPIFVGALAVAASIFSNTLKLEALTEKLNEHVISGKENGDKLEQIVIDHEKRLRVLEITNAQTAQKK